MVFRGDVVSKHYATLNINHGFLVLLENWLVEVKDVSLIVEIGCGDGLNLRYLAQRHPNIRFVGVDIIECIGGSEPNLEFIQADGVEFLERNTSGIDCVFGIDVVEHFDERRYLELLQLIASRQISVGFFQVPNCTSSIGQRFFFGDPTHKIPFTEDRLRYLAELVEGDTNLGIKFLYPTPKSFKEKVRYCCQRFCSFCIACFEYGYVGRSAFKVIRDPVLIFKVC